MSKRFCRFKIALIVLFSLQSTFSYGITFPKCLLGLSKIGTSVVASGTKLASTISKQMPWSPDPKAISTTEYASLRSTKIGDYFSKGKVTPEKTDLFLKDLSKVIANFDRMHLTKGKLRKSKEIQENLEKAKTLVFKNGFAASNKHKTIEQFVMDSNFEVGKPEDHKPNSAAKKVANTAKFIAKIPLKVSLASAAFVYDNAKFGVKMAVGAALVSTALGIALDPLKYLIDRQVNQNLGWLGVKISMALSDVEKVLEVKTKMENLNDELAAVNTKYKLSEIAPEEAEKLWNQINHTFLEYKRTMNSTIDDNIASGRVYFRDGNINYPLIFVNAAMSANNEMMNHEQLVLLYEAKKQSSSLSIEDEKRLQYHRDEMPKSRMRLSGTLTAWKVHEIIYPEFNRAQFMQKHPESIPLMSTYASFEKNFRMADYAEEFQKEMKEQLSDLGIHLHTPGLQKK